MMTDDGHDVDIDGDHYATCPGCKRDGERELTIEETTAALQQFIVRGTRAQKAVDDAIAKGTEQGGDQREHSGAEPLTDGGRQEAERGPERPRAERGDRDEDSPLPPQTIGVDWGRHADGSVYRCACGYRSNTARAMLIHQHLKHAP